LIHDPASARHLRVVPSIQFDFDLASPLHHPGDLERVIRTRLQTCELLAPLIGLRVHVSQLTHQTQRQLGLTSSLTSATTSLDGGVQATGPWTEEFPVLAAELQADIGNEQVGTLALMESHIPEDCSAFQPLSSSNQRKTSLKKTSPAFIKRRKTSMNTSNVSFTSPPSPPPALPLHHKLGLCPEGEHLTRLLPYPQKLNVPLRVGETFALGHELYKIEKLSFVRRLSDVKWWTESSLHRDYHWAWLRSTQGGTEALLFVDKRTGTGFVQAFCD
jgi:hypothetical protein